MRQRIVLLKMVITLIVINNAPLNGVAQLVWSIPNTVNDSDGNSLRIAEIEDRLNIHHQFELYAGTKVIKGTVTSFNKVTLGTDTFHQINLQDATQAGSAFTDGESVNVQINSNLVSRDEFSPIAFGSLDLLTLATPVTTDHLAFYDASNGGLRKATISTILALAGSVSFKVHDVTTGTPVATDYLVFSDADTANDPNRKAQISTILALASATLDITGLTAETSAADGDEIAIYDVSASANRKMTRSNFLDGAGLDIPSLTNLNDPAYDDEIAVYDNSASGLRRVTIDNFKKKYSRNE